MVNKRDPGLIPQKRVFPSINGNAPSIYKICRQKVKSFKGQFSKTEIALPTGTNILYLNQR